MKRDFELIRLLLMKIEELDGFNSTEVKDNWIEIYSKEEIIYHVVQLIEGGLVIGKDMSSHGDPFALVERLTWEGHDFLDNIKDDNIWGKIKESISKVSEATSYTVLKSVAIELTKKYLLDT